MTWAPSEREATITWADDTGVFSRTTVMDRPVGMGTLSQETLSSCAVHIIQQKLALSFAKLSLHRGCEGTATVQLPTHHISFIHVPVVIANPAPLAVVENLHTSRTSAWAIHQLQLWPVFQRHKNTTCQEKEHILHSPITHICGTGPGLSQTTLQMSQFTAHTWFCCHRVWSRICRNWRK